MRDRQEVVDRVNKVNEARNKRSKDLVAKGEPGLEPYVFDYVLLCNKICGRSHYNMQAKVIVESQTEFNNWLGAQAKLGKQVAEEKAKAEAEASVEVQPEAATAQPLDASIKTDSVANATNDSLVKETVK